MYTDNTTGRQIFLSISLAFGSISETHSFCVLSPKAHHHPWLSPSILKAWEGDKGSPSYWDSSLLDFHNKDQANKQSVTNSLALWNEDLQREQIRIIEWQDSFQRNNIADFTPPMSSGMNCLMVGGEELGGENIKLPWEDEAEADVTQLRMLEPQMDDHHHDGGGDTSVTTVPMIRTERVHREDSKASSSSSSSGGSITVSDPNKKAAQYDCIVDQGLMDAVIALNSPEAVKELLHEAAFAIREHGIYVLVTSTLSAETRKMLEDGTDGFEWEFELDGISNDTQVVSVARRYCTGEMPKVGRLSRYQP